MERVHEHSFAFCWFLIVNLVNSIMKSFFFQNPSRDASKTDEIEAIPTIEIVLRSIGSIVELTVILDDFNENFPGEVPLASGHK